MNNTGTKKPHLAMRLSCLHRLGVGVISDLPRNDMRSVPHSVSSSEHHLVYTFLAPRGGIDSLMPVAVRCGRTRYPDVFRMRLSPECSNVDCTSLLNDRRMRLAASRKHLGAVGADKRQQVRILPTGANEKARNRPEPSRTQVIPIKDHTAHCPRAYVQDAWHWYIYRKGNKYSITQTVQGMTRKGRDYD